MIAPPITYRVHGKQYVTVLSGYGASGALFGSLVSRHGWDYRTQAKRILTFRLDGDAKLPASPLPRRISVPADDTYRPDDAADLRGAVLFGRRCLVCHGMDAVATGLAPDLRTSSLPQSAAAFDAVVHEGLLVSRGMPRFEDLTDAQRSDIRQFLRHRSRDLAAGRGPN